MAYLNHFGQSTVISLLEANEVQHSFTTIASGGIRDAFDIFKALCLGAKSVGISATILSIFRCRIIVFAKKEAGTEMLNSAK